MKKEVTENLYKEKVNKVLDYINANLHSSLSLDILSSVIHVSIRHLLRIMQQELQESVLTYIARQRIERAVLYMQIENLNLTQLAEIVGYDNPQSFSKAFKKHFGISPKKYTNQLESRINYDIDHIGDNKKTLVSSISVEEDLNLVYIRIVGKYGDSEPYNNSWNKLISFLKENGLIFDTTRFLGISFNDPNVTTDEKCMFYACASINTEIIPQAEFGLFKIRGGAYAVYTLNGEYCELQEYYNLISLDRTYKMRYGISFEEYSNCSGNEEERITKIYIPIIM